MNKQTITIGILLILASITFWISWSLMPDPGTTDTVHILNIVKQSRESVFYSVTIQIISSLLYIVSLFLLIRNHPLKTGAVTGIILLGIGAMGLCADAFFHLLAFYMTDNTVSIQQDIIKVMTFMQTDALVFLVPLLLSLFAGSLILSISLNRQQQLSKIPVMLVIGSLLIGILGAIIGKTIPGFNIRLLSMIAIGLFAAGHTLTGFELVMDTAGRQEAVVENTVRIRKVSKETRSN